MRLNDASVERALTQIEAQAIPDDHPVVPQLKHLFGDHTYFIDGHGLNILQLTEHNPKGETVCQVVNLADWSDGDQRSLTPHEPQLTELTVVLASDADVLH